REVVDLGGGHLAAFGELAYFGGYHGEALTMIAGTCGFYRSVEGEQVGLPCDLPDDGDLFGDLLHGVYGLVYGAASVLDIICSLQGDLLCLLSVVGILLDVGYHLFHG